MTTQKSDKTKYDGKHKRYHSIVKGVPVVKYGFSEHLQKVGDWVVTYPIADVKERKKVRDAAYFWAWQHRCKVKCTTEFGGGGRCVRVEVIKAYR